MYCMCIAYTCLIFLLETQSVRVILAKCYFLMIVTAVLLLVDEKLVFLPTLTEVVGVGFFYLHLSFFTQYLKNDHHT